MLRLQLLGGFRAQAQDADVSALAKQPRRAALLTYLAVERDVARERVITLLWPDAAQERGRHSLNQGIYYLRRLIGADWVELHGDRIVVAPWLTTDVLDLEAAAASDRHEDVLNLYRGALLASTGITATADFDIWVDARGASIDRLHRRARRETLSALIADGRADDALRCAEQWCRFDPLEDEAQHRFIELLARSGQRAEALRQFASYRRLLEEHELWPLDETLQLVEHLQQGEAGPLPAVHAHSPERGMAAERAAERAAARPGGAATVDYPPSREPVTQAAGVHAAERAETSHAPGADASAPPALDAHARGTPAPHAHARATPAPDAHARATTPAPDAHARTTPALLRTRHGLLALLAVVFAVNWLQTTVETLLAPRVPLIADLRIRFARAAHWFEGHYAFEYHELTNPVAVVGYSTAYFFLLPALLVGVGAACYHRPGIRPFRTFSLAIAVDYTLSLPFFLLMPVPERWTYPQSGAMVLSDMWASRLIDLFRPISGIDNSFPSFHVSLTMALVLTSFVFNLRYRWSVLFLGAPVVLATYVLGIHWLTDLVAGAAVGVLSVMLALRIDRALPDAATAPRKSASVRPARLATAALPGKDSP
jgi:DNA-binding SARP family transcriptional activator/membrane-associated phospholipid phosphatase